MALVVSNISELLMLQYIVNMLGQDGNAAPAGGERLLRLFTNNLTPGESTVLADVTEATAAGYARITLAGASWTTTQVAGTTTAVYSQQTFTFTTAVTVYGYYVTTIEGTPRLLWLERFTSAPFQLPPGGGQVSIDPAI